MRRMFGIGLVYLVGLAGCSGDRGPEPLSRRELATIPAVKPTELKALLEEHKGKVVVLAVWSVRREEAVAMYPKLNDLCTGEEPVVIAVNIDRVDDVREKALPLVRKHQPKFLNRVAAGGPDILMAFMGRDWHGQVPAITLYDREGKQVKTFDGPDALAAAQKQLKKLLEQPKP